MSFLILVALIVIIWLLWTICRNTGDALDKQTALQYEIVSLEKRLEELADALKGETPAESSVPAKPARSSKKTT
ncbi:hypothetical protein [Mangrovitalea sediminis]|uniref:hypothetical protein n=1 Tax=Mangrovitalea sediminis TaxID=1982043 RepID=UPI000BE4B401|nr:hypothetical protein [Mangrovitalea sediminis]